MSFLWVLSLRNTDPQCGWEFMRDEGGKAQPLFFPGISLHFQIYFLLNILGPFYYHLLKSYIYWLEYLEIQGSFFIFIFSFFREEWLSQSHEIGALRTLHSYAWAWDHQHLSYWIFLTSLHDLFCQTLSSSRLCLIVDGVCRFGPNLVRFWLPQTAVFAASQTHKRPAEEAEVDEKHSPSCESGAYYISGHKRWPGKQFKKQASPDSAPPGTGWAPCYKIYTRLYKSLWYHFQLSLKA